MVLRLVIATNFAFSTKVYIKEEEKGICLGIETLLPILSTFALFLTGVLKIREVITYTIYLCLILLYYYIFRVIKSFMILSILKNSLLIS